MDPLTIWEELSDDGKNFRAWEDWNVQIIACVESVEATESQARANNRVVPSLEDFKVDDLREPLAENDLIVAVEDNFWVETYIFKIRSDELEYLKSWAAKYFSGGNVNYVKIQRYDIDSGQWLTRQKVPCSDS